MRILDPFLTCFAWNGLNRSNIEAFILNYGFQSDKGFQSTSLLYIFLNLKQIFRPNGKEKHDAPSIRGLPI